jgi:hypothetical protein
MTRSHTDDTRSHLDGTPTHNDDTRSHFDDASSDADDARSQNDNGASDHLDSGSENEPGVRQNDDQARDGETSARHHDASVRGGAATHGCQELSVSRFLFHRSPSPADRFLASCFLGSVSSTSMPQKLQTESTSQIIEVTSPLRFAVKSVIASATKRFPFRDLGRSPTLLSLASPVGSWICARPTAAVCGFRRALDLWRWRSNPRASRP